MDEAEVVVVQPNPPPAEDFLEAARSHDPELFRRLREQPGGDINIKNSVGRTALHLAILENDDAAVNVLLDQGADIEAAAPDDERPLFMAVELSQAKIVQDLLERHALPNAAARGFTPLHVAALHGDLDVVRLLLEHGADLTATSWDQREPLFTAVWKGHSGVVKLLLDRGADPDAFSADDPTTALHVAAESGNVDIMQMLLKPDAKVDWPDVNKLTPLVRAVAAGNLGAAALLLQHGASTRVWCGPGQSLLGLAEGNRQMGELLKSERILRGPRMRISEKATDSDQADQAFTELRPPVLAEKDKDKVAACHGFEVIITEFFTGGPYEDSIPKTASVYDLLYSLGPEAFRSQLDGRKPSFTWYHFPANNMVWVEGLIRRLTVEKGGTSAEAYEEIKAELGLSKRLTRRKPRPAATNLPIVRPHCRSVQGSDAFSLTENKGSIISAVPFLHFETFEGHRQMLDTLEQVRKPETKATPRFQTQTEPPARINVNFAPAARRVRPPRNSSTGPKWSIRSLSQKFGSLWGRKPESPQSSVATDLEGQPERHANSSHGSGVRPPHGDQGGEDQIANGLGAQRNSQSHDSGANQSLATGGSRSHHTARDDFPSVRSGGLGSVDDGHISPARDAQEGGQVATTSGAQHHHHEGDPQSQEAVETSAQQPRNWQTLDPPPGNLNEYLVKGYLGPGKAGLEARRTLDQYTYAYVETTSHRDDDQVIYRYTKDGALGEPKIFMVDQLWLWVLGNDTIITCCPIRWNPWLLRGPRQTTTPAVEASTARSLARWLGVQPVAMRSTRPRNPAFFAPPPPNRRDSIKTLKRHGSTEESQPQTHGAWTAKQWPVIDPNDPLNVSKLVTQHLLKKGRGPIETVYEFAGLITICCLDLFDPQSVPDEFQFFDFFERSIGSANDKVANLLRQFKEAVNEFKEGVRSHEVTDITEETELMIEVDDILDELHTLKLVLTDQKTVVGQLNQALKEAGWKQSSVKTRTLDSHLLRIEQMENAAKKANTSLHRLVDLKQKQASLTEAWYARESAMDTARQGKTVLIFTVVTIIFLPLSFLASMFDIDADAYPRNGDDQIPFGYLLRHILSIGLALAIPLIVIAFNVDRIARWLSFIRESADSLWKWGIRLSVAAAFLSAILIPVWTSELSHGIKASVSIFIAAMAFAGALLYGLNVLVTLARRQGGGADLSDTLTTAS